MIQISRAATRRWFTSFGGLLVVVSAGCARHQQRPMITAVGLSPANQCEVPGIPYYLPKPLLVVAKNVRHIDESKVGLTGPAPIPGGFDNQAAYADLKANVTVPGTTATPASGGDTTFSQNLDGSMTPSSHAMVGEKMTPAGTIDDGIEPDSFYTYQVIFIPDLTQKYGLQIQGGAGEFRAAMNMVNGWMYTGMGPYYFKDSSSAQNAMATGVASMYAGRGAADVLNEVGDLTTAIGQLPSRQEGAEFDRVGNLTEAFKAIAQAAELTPKVPETMLNYAEIHIYEPVLMPDGSGTEWRLVAEHHFDRQFFSPADSEKAAEAKAKIVNTMVKALAGSFAGGAPGKQQTDDDAEDPNDDADTGNPAKDRSDQRAAAMKKLGDPESGEFQLRSPSGDRIDLGPGALETIPTPATPPVIDGVPADRQPEPGDGAAAGRPVQINIAPAAAQSQPRPRHLDGLRRLLHQEKPKIQTKTLNQIQTEYSR